MCLQKEIEATKNLLDICNDDGLDGVHVSAIRSCLVSLQGGNINEALEHFHEVPLIGMGRFGDYCLKASNRHFLESAVAQWEFLMQRHAQ